MSRPPHYQEPEALHRGLGYFPAVDGLRAVAVGTVILFHLQESLLPGGFVEVDIFFVISGFVVTASLAHLHFPGFGRLLAYFYARRLTRIAPALCVSLLATILVYVVLIPRQWISFIADRTAVAAFVGLGNLAIVRYSDAYFDFASELNPFLHTWSLGVEEQFYLIFPFLLFFHGRARSSALMEKASLLAIIVLGLASFAACGLLAGINMKYSFYLLPSRFWELALGMVLALTSTRWRDKVGRLGARKVDGLATASALLLALSLAFPDEQHFPFPTALLPTVATALCIVVVCARPSHWSARALGSGPMLWIGLRSYSLYLWHWPVYALMRWTIGLDRLLLQLTAVAATAILADLSYRFVETPFRTSAALKAPARWKVAVSAAAASCLAMLAGAALLLLQPALSISRTSATEDWYTSDDDPLLAGPAGCRLTATTRQLANGKVTTWTRTGCPSAVRPGRVFAIGDSHALTFRPMLRQFALDTGHEVRLYFRSGCAYLPLYEKMATIENCALYFQKAGADLRSELTRRDILFMSSLRVVDRRYREGGKTPPVADTVRRREALGEARTMLSDLARETGALLVFEAPKPRMPSPVYRCVDWYTAGNPICAGGLAVSRAKALANRSRIIAMMRDLAAGNDRVRIWDALPVLCGQVRCEAFDGDKPVFFDINHITPHGNRMLRKKFGSDFSRWFDENEQPLSAPTP